MTRRVSIVAVLTLLASPCCNAAGAERPKNAEFPNRLLELFCIKDGYSAGEKVLLGYRLTNCAEDAFTEHMPFEWGGLVWDWFEVSLNDKKLENPLAHYNYAFNKKTVLAPGESVTVVFSLDRICTRPKEEDARVGQYVVSTRGIADNAWPQMPILVTKPLAFNVEKEKARCELGLEQITKDGDLAKAILLVKSSTLCPDDRLTLLRAAAKGGKPFFWKLISQCPDDAYAMVTAVNELPADALDKEGLLGMSKSKDLFIRRMAIKNLARTGKDADAAEKLAAFLKTQKDELVLDAGKAALKALRD